MPNLDLLLSPQELENYTPPDDGFIYDPYYNQKKNAMFCGFKKLTLNINTGFYTEYKSITCKGFAVCPTCEEIRKKEVHKRVYDILWYAKQNNIPTYKIITHNKKDKRKLMQKISNKCRPRFSRHFAATLPYFAQERLNHNNIGFITLTTVRVENSIKYGLSDFVTEYPLSDDFEPAITPIKHRISYINNDNTFDAVKIEAVSQSEGERLVYEKFINDSVNAVASGEYTELNNGQFTDGELISMVRAANESNELSDEAKKKVVEVCKVEPVIVNPTEWVLSEKNKELFDRIQLEAKIKLAPSYTLLNNSNINQYIKEFSDCIWDLITAYNELNTKQLLIETKLKEFVLYKPIDFEYDWLDFEKYLVREQ